jgi:hypothetical protein
MGVISFLFGADQNGGSQRLVSGARLSKVLGRQSMTRCAYPDRRNQSRAWVEAFERMRKSPGFDGR